MDIVEIKDRLHAFFLKIKDEKRKRGEKFTQGDFYMDFSPNYGDRMSGGGRVSEWFNHDKTTLPNWDEWERICKKYGCSMDYFILGKGDSTPRATGGKFDNLTEKDIGRLLFVELPKRFPYQIQTYNTRDKTAEYSSKTAALVIPETVLVVSLVLPNDGFAAAAHGVASAYKNDFPVEVRPLTISGALNLLDDSHSMPLKDSPSAGEEDTQGEEDSAPDSKQ